MKYFRPAYLLPFVISLVVISTATFVACEKDASIVPDTTAALDGTMVSKKGGRATTGTVGTGSLDTLYQRCGMVITDTACTYPVVTVNNINPYLRNLPSSDSTYYSQLVIRFDAPMITGKVISSYILFADQCSGRPACTKMNGIYMSQVTAGVPYNAFYISIGTSWLNPYVTSYTGIIMACTTDGCMYASQPFNFSPPRVL